MSLFKRPSQPTPEFKSISDDELSQKLRAQSEWLAETEPKDDDTRRLDLSGFDLSKRKFIEENLTKANFRGANLKGAVLKRCNLTDADFRDAVLTHADLTGAELSNTSFRNANLERATLTDTKNLTAQAIGGANLYNIEPADAVKLDGTTYVDEGLKNAGKLYLTLLAVCIFTIVVVLSTKDPQIVMATGEAKLPIGDVKIPIAWFFLVVPVLIVITHATLHLHLLRAWEGMAADLPAVFPDGKTIDRKVHPLLIKQHCTSTLSAVAQQASALHMDTGTFERKNSTAFLLVIGRASYRGRTSTRRPLCGCSAFRAESASRKDG